jgi:hypothetical protein
MFRMFRIINHSRRTGPLALALLVVALAPLAFGACDQDDQPQSETPGPTSTSLSGTPVPTAGPDAGSLELLAEKYVAGVDGHITYAIDSENFGTHPVGTWATYRLGNALREDWISNAFGYDETSVVISAGDRFVLCNKTAFSESCSEQRDASSLGLILVLFTPIKDIPAALLSQDLDYTFTELPDDEIAGVTGRCFDVSLNGRIGPGEPGTEQIKMCFTEDGGLLRFERRVTFEDPALPQAWITATAEDVSEATSDDFLPPVSPAPLRD